MQYLVKNDKYTPEIVNKEIEFYKKFKIYSYKLKPRTFKRQYNIVTNKSEPTGLANKKFYELPNLQFYEKHRNGTIYDIIKVDSDTRSIILYTMEE